MLNASNLNLSGIQSTLSGDISGQMFALFVIIVAVCEAAVGLAIVIQVYHYYHTSVPGEVDELSDKNFGRNINISQFVLYHMSGTYADLPLVSFIVAFAISEKYSWLVSFSAPFLLLINTLAAFVVFFWTWNNPPFTTEWTWILLRRTFFYRRRLNQQHFSIDVGSGYVGFLPCKFLFDRIYGRRP